MPKNRPFYNFHNTLAAARQKARFWDWPYVVEDYGSALVGKRTIDLYKPSRNAMNAWGVRDVKIDIVKWGSYQESLDVLKPRTKYGHVRKMVDRLRQKI